MTGSNDPVPIESVQRNKPLKPIVLDEFGNTLEERTPDFPHEHVIDSDPLQSNRPDDLYVGKHGVCGGTFIRLHSSPKYDSLLCRPCTLRVQIPVGIKTYGDLRAFVRRKAAERQRELNDRGRARTLCDLNTPMR